MRYRGHKGLLIAEFHQRHSQAGRDVDGGSFSRLEQSANERVGVRATPTQSPGWVTGRSGFSVSERLAPSNWRLARGRGCRLLLQVEGEIIMPDAADFGALFGSLKAITDLAKLMIDARDASVVRAKANELQREIIAAQSSALAAQTGQLALLERKRELEKEVADLKTWEAEKKKYELTNVRPQNDPTGAAFAYALKEAASSTEPKHFLCANCYQQGYKSILQQEHRVPGAVDIMFCQRCSAEINLTGVTYTNLPRPQSPRRPR
jgi:hypothetical protein